MSIIQFLDPPEIERRRAQLLKEAGLSVEVLRARRQRGLLDLDAQGLLDEIEDLEYLAGADEPANDEH